MIRLIYGMFSFLDQARHYSRIDPGHAPSAAELAGHRRVVAVAAAFGLVGFLAGVSLPIGYLLSEPTPGAPPPKDALKGVFAMLMAGPILGVVGTVFGAALGCALAPRAFYEGPVGRKWLQMVGVEGVGAARVVCLLVVGIVTGVVGLIAYVELTRP